MEQIDAPDADRAESVSVIAVLEVHIEWPLLAALGGALIGHLQRGFHSARAVARVENPGQSGGRRGGQHGGKFDAGLVRQPEERRVRHLVELAAYRVVDLRHPMAVDAGPQR